MKISIGSDHAGFDVKRDLIEYLKSKGYAILDCGTDSNESVDYPEFAHKVGFTITKLEANKGIVICGSGIGVSISANKLKGIRCALCTSENHAVMSRKHNDSNVLALGARMTDFEMIKKITEIWLSTEFEGGRHQRRIEKIEV
ncbi:MAG: ribose 5-phosphate isomerase B [Candidatus Marinimicrobia bacterium]|nr:ribose 5-phosphate isomerase B [Candidatus Neomarinimicrobiota bacterium]MBL7022636.1 ribose 5-phosphate isomerase B [Candidatus Neomarinimicrobiota bacterium]